VHNREVGCKATKFYPIQILHHGYNIDERRTKEKFARTASLLKKQIERDPKDPLPHHYLSVSYMSMGGLDPFFYEKAVEEALLAIRLADKEAENDPAYLGTHYVAAASLLNLGHLNRTEQLCRRALDICPDHLDSWFLLAKLYNKTGPLIEARQFAKRYLEIRERIRTMPERFGKIIHNNFNGDWFAWFVMGKAKYEEGSKVEAQSFFRRAMKRVSANHSACALIGDYYFKKGEYGLAVPYLKDCCDHQKEKVFLYMLCECYARLGESNGQIRVLSEIVQRYPEEVKNLVQIGLNHLEKSQLEVARFCLETAVGKGNIPRNVLNKLKTAEAAL
jgi:tetratricopeptide (TPR) repeat protein